MDVTELRGREQHGPEHGAVVWWSCADCGADVELPGAETAGFLLGCPDCPGPLVELWRWEPSAA
jgi:hypothetical protein